MAGSLPALMRIIAELCCKEEHVVERTILPASNGTSCIWQGLKANNCDVSCNDDEWLQIRSDTGGKNF